MNDQYLFKSIEPKWQRIWEERSAFRTPSDPVELNAKPKYYILDMFPYPSGAGLHVGHPEGYTATDVLARMKRMQGFNVLHPMGWDAFGLPAERAAVRENIHPAIITKRNVESFRGQIKRLGFSYDWEREIDTSGPDYYRWTQWIFLKLHEKGLAYMSEVPVNWCPALGTVLANEEVKDGCYVETGDPVERRLMKQWMLRITAYAERLLADLEAVDWPEGVKDMQRNWIGKSVGAEIDFEIAEHLGERFTVYTTRPDTLFGATYCVLAPEHPLVASIASAALRDAVMKYAGAARQKTELARTDLAKSKTGVFTGANAIHPVTGAKIPIWVADYALMSYGTGAIMAVPAHDSRDHEFARTFGIEIREVIRPPQGAAVKPVSEAAFEGEGTCANSGFLDGLPSESAKKRMTGWLEANRKGRERVQYRLRDWLFSRQRYWGEPFPIIHLEDATMMTLPEAELPVKLPPVDEYRPTEDGKPPLARAADDWLMVTLPDGRKGMRETNTMPQWAGSCWYYLRYLDPKNETAAWTKETEQYWMPVDLYVGGVEHAVLHLLYSRFWHKVLYDCGLVHTSEPFQKLFNQGMILAYSYCDSRGKYHHYSEVEERGGAHYLKGTGEKLETQIEKMSKSKFNVVNPDDVIDQYGADSLRLYELFMGPLEQVKPWQVDGVEGVSRFLGRVWRMVFGNLSLVKDVEPYRAEHAAIANSDAKRLRTKTHQTIRKVTGDLEPHLRFNTAISALMELVNETYIFKAELHDEQSRQILRETIESLLKLLNPFAPHLCEELWEELGGKSLLAHEAWPTYDLNAVELDTVTVVVQVNGKLRGSFVVAKTITEEELRLIAVKDLKVAQFLEGKEILKVIHVPNKLLNFVVKA